MSLKALTRLMPRRYRCECGATFHTEAALVGHEAEHRPNERTKR